MENNYTYAQEAQEKKGSIIGGFIGALLGAAIGAVAWTLVGMLGSYGLIKAARKKPEAAPAAVDPDAPTVENEDISA